LSDRAQAFAGDLLTATAPDLDDPEALLQQELIALLPTLRQLPRHAERLAVMAEKGTLSLRITRFADQHDVDVVTRLVNRTLVTVGSLAAAVAGAVLVAADTGPIVGEVALSMVVGGVLVLVGSVLGLRVLAAIARDGLS
jgi:ubiquinone biosynthesis protein